MALSRVQLGDRGGVNTHFGALGTGHYLSPGGGVGGFWGGSLDF